MCLIIFAWQIVPQFSVIAAANRDEFYTRPSAPASWWKDYPHIYAGRDLQGGGTWLGITRSGRFAALTNVRMPTESCIEMPTRGMLAVNFLNSQQTPAEYIAQFIAQAPQYQGFNLLIGDQKQLIWYSNKNTNDVRNGQPLPPGIYGLSNAALDVFWPKVVRSKAQFSSLLYQNAPDACFFDMLSDTTRADDCRLPSTGIDLEQERMLSSIFVESPTYGTRSSTLIKVNASGHGMLHERLVTATTYPALPLRKHTVQTTLCRHTKQKIL